MVFRNDFLFPHLDNAILLNKPLPIAFFPRQTFKNIVMKHLLLRLNQMLYYTLCLSYHSKTEAVLRQAGQSQRVTYGSSILTRMDV